LRVTITADPSATVRPRHHGIDAVKGIALTMSLKVTVTYLGGGNAA
jgi:hypothetical protein